MANKASAPEAGEPPTLLEELAAKPASQAAIREPRISAADRLKIVNAESATYSRLREQKQVPITVDGSLTANLPLVVVVNGARFSIPANLPDVLVPEQVFDIASKALRHRRDVEMAARRNSLQYARSGGGLGE